MDDFLNKFLKNVAWPAAAGNVAWSFATLAIDHKNSTDTFSRLAVLFILAIYLSAEWYRSLNVTSTREGLILDLIFVLCVVWFAIATQLNSGFPGIALLIILFGVGGGHLFGVWPPAGEGKGNLLHGCVSVLVAAGLTFSWCKLGSWNWWVALAALTIVLIVWACVRRNQPA